MKRTWKHILASIALPSLMAGCYGLGGPSNSCGPQGCGPQACGPQGCGPRGGHEFSRWDRCVTVVPGSMPEPNGTYVRRFQQIQANLAEQDDFVFYLSEWRDLKLTPYGEYHLHQAAYRLQEPNMKNLVVVQYGIDHAQNENRRRIIADYLTEAGVPNAPQKRVVVGYPEAEGMASSTAQRIVSGADGLFGAFGGGMGGGMGFGGGFGGFGGFGGGGGGLTGGGFYIP